MTKTRLNNLKREVARAEHVARIKPTTTNRARLARLEKVLNAALTAALSAK